jgi:hypothetical protein
LFAILSGLDVMAIGSLLLRYRLGTENTQVIIVSLQIFLNTAVSVRAVPFLLDQQVFTSRGWFSYGVSLAM